jgi:hypothetical protein
MQGPNAVGYEDVIGDPEASLELKRAAAHCLIDWEAVEDLYETTKASGHPRCFHAVIMVAMEELHAVSLLADCANDLAA